MLLSFKKKISPIGIHASSKTSNEIILGKDEEKFVYILPALNHLIFKSNFKNNNLYSADIFPHVLAFNGITILFDELHQGDSLYDNLIKTFKERGGVAKVFDCASNISFKRFFSAINPDDFNSLFLEWVNNEISGILNNVTPNTKTLLVFKNSNYLHNDTFINFRIHFNEYYHKKFLDNTSLIISITSQEPQNLSFFQKVLSEQSCPKHRFILCLAPTNVSKQDALFGLFNVITINKLEPGTSNMFFNSVCQWFNGIFGNIDEANLLYSMGVDEKYLIMNNSGKLLKKVNLSK